METKTGQEGRTVIPDMRIGQENMTRGQDRRTEKDGRTGGRTEGQDKKTGQNDMIKR